jgi:hypothetical protein
MILVDSHAHLYESFPMAEAFDAAWSNFESAAAAVGTQKQYQAVMLVAATGADSLRNRLLMASFRRWSIAKTAEASSLVARRGETGEIHLILGLQTVCAEGLEILCFAAPCRIRRGGPARDLLREIASAGGIAIIPWGFGKWTGNRKATLMQLMQGPAAGFFLGDNGGRSKLWPNSDVFRAAAKFGIPVLPGSDPLPLPREWMRIAAVGFALAGRLSTARPAADLRSLLGENPLTLFPYGDRMPLSDFIKTQIQLRFARGFFRRLQTK